jgi:acyl-coenzyme A thioesterase PaaI-like protein
MKLNTHLELNTSLNGKVTKLEENFAQVTLCTSQMMVADSHGLVHGGFVFTAADYAAMACINDPFVVLAKSEVKFTAPVKVGQTVKLEAALKNSDGFKSTVDVVGTVEGKSVFKGVFYTATLKKHVLDK